MDQLKSNHFCLLRDLSRISELSNWSWFCYGSINVCQIWATYLLQSVVYLDSHFNLTTSVNSILVFQNLFLFFLLSIFHLLHKMINHDFFSALKNAVLSASNLFLYNSFFQLQSSNNQKNWQFIYVWLFFCLRLYYFSIVNCHVFVSFFITIYNVDFCPLFPLK